jgi:hypothetical protein
MACLQPMLNGPQEARPDLVIAVWHASDYEVVRRTMERFEVPSICLLGTHICGKRRVQSNGKDSLRSSKSIRRVRDHFRRVLER